MSKWTPAFGDFVTNPNASDKNPIKHGYFVEMRGGLFRCTDGSGRFWESAEIVPFEITEAMRHQDELEAMHG